MLVQLKIQNFALIDHLEVSFDEGMTCITGETGAGKSILLGGLSLVLGKRADLSSLLDPSQKCIVEATFEIASYLLESLFVELDLDYETTTILRREILPQGKSRAFINDMPVRLSVLEQVSERLIDIHSQTDTQTLLKNEYQFQVLDALAQNGNVLIEYKKALSIYKKSTQQYNRLLHQEEESKESQEFKQFLFDELQSAKLETGIYEQWEEQYASLTHIDYLQTSLAEVIQLIENESIGILDQLFRVRSLANSLEEKSNQFSPLSNRFRSLAIEMEDVYEECKQQLENLEANPQELEILQQKMDLVNSLFQKHKVQTVSELIQIQEQLEKDLEQTADLEETLKKLKEIQLKQEKDLIHLSDVLSQNRKKATSVLEAELVGLVNKMGMENARFKIDLSPSEEFLFNGKDQLSFLFSANTGGEFQLLKKVASGGELSRIMLSIKAVLSRYKKLPTLIFDEIDTGVSGKISDSIADIMVALAHKLQVFTITHLPQVAAKGNHHFKVYKSIKEGKTYTHLNGLSDADRIQEIAMMLSGNQITPTAIAHAKQLMN